MPRRRVHLEREGRDAERARAAPAHAPVGGPACSLAGSRALSAPRITGGTHRGRPLPRAVPDGVRPTAGRVREALFSLVGQDLRGARVLDACGGTGLVAFEAVSRGADATVVERDPARARWIGEAARALGLPVTVIRGDAAALADGLGHFDGAYVDPPYAVDASAIVEAVARVCRDWLVVESRAGAAGPTAPPGFAAEPVRRYGEAALRVFRRAGEAR